MTTPGLDRWITGNWGQTDRRGRPLWQVDEDEEQEEEDEPCL